MVCGNLEPHPTAGLVSPFESGRIPVGTGLAKYGILLLTFSVKVAFHSRLLTERGSEGAMLDYARMNRSILGNESILCLPNNPAFATNPLLKKWQEEFAVILYQSKKDLSRRLVREGVETIYLTKPGPWDGFLVPGLRNCVHTQFLCDEFHGDAYAYLSPWMSRVMTGREESFVPFFVPRFRSGKPSGKTGNSQRGQGIRAARGLGHVQYPLRAQDGGGARAPASGGPFCVPEHGTGTGNGAPEKCPLFVCHRGSRRKRGVSGNL